MRLTQKQQKFFQAIQSFLREHKYPPSVRDLCALTGLKSPSTAHGYLERLKKKGLIEWESSKPRTLKIAR
ncbi:helix-turn-helix domain-containing protein [Paenibacillus naphthalenovorans]|uniref:LexA family protein n=1 Tax=Paenibacillus naphthalenovorans TaxID=162209 RepID=UPI0008815233|nr:helix-turn-helix domain-containing protein [Paenibacillus naphthalenovorans]SDJ93301.1 repressor LexA [Paenibacillus naphthalenovorans]